MNEHERGARITEALFNEATHPNRGLWWLSFASESGFLGVCIVEANGIALAVAKTHLLGINPGGSVGTLGPLPLSAIGEEWRDRLLSKEEAMSVPDPWA